MEIAAFLQAASAAATRPLTAIDRAWRALDFLYRSALGINLGDVPMPKPPKLLDRVRQVLRVRNYSPRTEDCYVQWVQRYVRFHGLRHPRDLGDWTHDDICGAADASRRIGRAPQTVSPQRHGTAAG